MSERYKPRRAISAPPAKAPTMVDANPNSFKKVFQKYDKLVSKYVIDICMHVKTHGIHVLDACSGKEERM
jgi:hypothetical protein